MLNIIILVLLILLLLIYPEVVYFLGSKQLRERREPGNVRGAGAERTHGGDKRKCRVRPDSPIF